MSSTAVTATGREGKAAQRRERYWRRVIEGLCAHCGEPRGEGGTSTMCRPCADLATERQRRAAAEGRCVQCGRPRGEDGTRTYCRPCAKKNVACSIKGIQRRIERGDCPKHGTALQMLELCPACRYEQPGGRITDLTFKGLLPPPSAGGEMETCVGCERCGRRYHKGSSYRAPLTHRLKLKDEHVGEEGQGMWLLFEQEDEDGVPTKYEMCSTPDKECVRKISGLKARQYLADQRSGRRVPGVCGEHVRSARFILEAAQARLGAAAQPQNGEGQGSSNADKRSAERKEFENVVAGLLDNLPPHKIGRAEIAAAYDVHRNTRESLDPSTITHIVKRCYPKGTAVADAVALVVESRSR